MPAKKATKTVEKAASHVDEEKKTEAVAKAAKTVSKVAKSPAKKEVSKDAETTASTAKEVKQATKVSSKTVTKPATKKTTKKAETAKEEKPVETKSSKAQAAVPKTTAKKTTTKKAVTTKTAEKKTTAKKTTAKATVTKTASTKKTTATKKAAVKKEKKMTPAEKYGQFAFDTLMDLAKAMGVQAEFSDFEHLFVQTSDLVEIKNRLIEQYGLKNKTFNYEEDGYDLDVLDILLEQLEKKIDLKAGDFIELAREIEQTCTKELGEDREANNALYDELFDRMRKVLMTAQRNNIYDLNALQELIPTDLNVLLDKFMKVAYSVLSYWQYDDVKYYENFLFAVLSQIDVWHKEMGTRALMDVADLYIMHGDYGLGDANYQYILRENQIKDYIYLRYSRVYWDIDRNKSKSIAAGAMQYVDGRYTYYPDLISILESN